MNFILNSYLLKELSIDDLNAIEHEESFGNDSFDVEMMAQVTENMVSTFTYNYIYTATKYVPLVLLKIFYFNFFFVSTSKLVDAFYITLREGKKGNFENQLLKHNDYVNKYNVLLQGPPTFDFTFRIPLRPLQQTDCLENARKTGCLHLLLLQCHTMIKWTLPSLRF